MAEHKVNDATWNIVKTARETNQAITESAVAAYERNIAFAQNTFENGVEVLKNHAESARSLWHEQAEQVQQRQSPDWQPVLNSTIAAQELNVRYAQSVVENGAEVLKTHVRSTRDLMQTLAEQARKQQEAFQTLARESVDAYVDFLFAPFAYYQQAVDTAESIAWQGVETAQKITRQSIDAAQKATRQGAETVQRAARQGQQAAQQATDTK